MDSKNIEHYDDTYLSGDKVDQIVFNAGEHSAVPKVKWSLPNGDRLTTTLADYNRNFRFIFNNEAKWRNAMNILKRKRMGLTASETEELEDFEKFKKDYFDRLKRGEKQSGQAD